jgi:hypothetical protein
MEKSIDKQIDELRDKRFREMVMSCKMFISLIQNCLDDDFKSFFKSDIKTWIDELNNIKKESDYFTSIKE